MDKQLDILLCDLDAFFASVEILDRPELKGKPLIVGGSLKNRGVVLTCSYEARKYGVHSAMPMQRATKLCPQAVILKGRMGRYKELSGQVRHVLKRHAVKLEVVSIDEAYLAVPGGHGLETARQIRQSVKEELSLPISIGVSSNKLLAKISCDLAKPDNIGVLFPAEVKERLWPHPVRLLPGVGPVTAATLKRLGIKSIGDLAKFPLLGLIEALGSSAAVIQGYACGVDQRRVEPETCAKSISEETTFSEDVYDDEVVGVTLSVLAAGVGYELRKANLTSHTVTLKLRYSDFRTITRSQTLAGPTDKDSVLYKCALQLFEKHKGRPPWRLVGLQASTLEKDQQLSLFKPSTVEIKEEILTKTRDRLRLKYGSTVVFQANQLKKKAPS